MSGVVIQQKGASVVAPRAPRRPASPEAPVPGLAKQDALALSPKARKETYASPAEAAAQGAAEGAAIGGAIANAAIGTMMIRKGLQGAAALPTRAAGKVLPVVGIGLSAWGMAASGIALKNQLGAETIDKRAVAASGLSFVGNALIAGGSVAVLTGVGTAPGLVASGAGFVMTAASALIAP
ncbi:MAG TPA: hypothetical protein V6D00_04210 [Pantanalinema sp.]